MEFFADEFLRAWQGIGFDTRALARHLDRFGLCVQFGDGAFGGCGFGSLVLWLGSGGLWCGCRVHWAGLGSVVGGLGEGA